jgi:hypothetical protein
MRRAVQEPGGKSPSRAAPARHSIAAWPPGERWSEMTLFQGERRRIFLYFYIYSFYKSTKPCTPSFKMVEFLGSLISKAQLCEIQKNSNDSPHS